jgi:hypothetical protein
MNEEHYFNELNQSTLQRLAQAVEERQVEIELGGGQNPVLGQLWRALVLRTGNSLISTGNYLRKRAQPSPSLPMGGRVFNTLAR